MSDRFLPGVSVEPGSSHFIEGYRDALRAERPELEEAVAVLRGLPKDQLALALRGVYWLVSDAAELARNNLVSGGNSRREADVYVGAMRAGASEYFDALVALLDISLTDIGIAESTIVQTFHDREEAMNKMGI
jgi:hypothetical protein